MGAAYDNLSDLARWQWCAFMIDDAHLGVGTRLARRTQQTSRASVRRVAVWSKQCRHRRELGLAESLHELGMREPVKGSQQKRLGDGRPSVSDAAHARQVEVVDARVIQQQLQHDGNQSQTLYSMLFDGLKHRGRVEGRQNHLRSPDQRAYH